MSGCNIRRFALVVREMQRFGKPVENEEDGAEKVPRILSMSSVQESDEIERGKIMDAYRCGCRSGTSHHTNIYRRVLRQDQL